MNKLKKSSILGKIILIIMSLFLGVSLISFNYFAIGRSELNNNGFIFNNYFTIADSADAVWKLYQDEISGEVTGEDGKCGSSTKKGTLTLTYTNNDDCTLSFDLILNLNGGTFKLNGNSIQTNGSNTIELKKGEKLMFFLESNKGNYTSKVNIKNIKCAIKKEITLTFKKPENGTYTVNKKEITLDETINTSAANVFNLEAKPLDGYDFYGWMFNDNIFSFKLSFEYYFTENTIVYPFFTKKESPLFLFENHYFDDLNEALSKANVSASQTKEIKLVKSGTIKNHNSTEIVYDFNGVSLAIPSGEENLSTYDTPSFGKSKKQNELYRKLVIDDNIVLNFRLKSSLIVNTELVYAASGGEIGGGSPQGKYGQIHLNGENSKIIFDNGSYLYAYGYITGNGIVNAKNGSTITELFQINDFRGGTATSKMGNKVFPFNQYYVQNVECQLRLETGAIEKVITALYALGGIKVANFKFVSTIASSEASLFKLSNNSILSRYYDCNKDKILYELEEGSADISPISLKVIGISVNAADYTLPIASNMELKLKAYTSVNINQELYFLPGSKITIENNSTLTISKGYKIYLYDKNSWVGKTFAFHGDISEICYSPTKKYKRNELDLYNVIVNINGKLNIESGAGVFTTYDGENYANVFSSNGTGEVSYNGTPFRETNTYQYDKSTNKHTLSVMQLALRNSREEIESSNDSFLKLSAEETLNDSTYYFSVSDSKWLKKSSATNVFKITFFDAINNLNVTKQYTVNKDFVFPSSDEEEFSGFKLNKDFYLYTL